MCEPGKKTATSLWLLNSSSDATERSGGSKNLIGIPDSYIVGDCTYVRVIYARSSSRIVISSEWQLRYGRNIFLGNTEVLSLNSGITRVGFRKELI